MPLFWLVTGIGIGFLDIIFGNVLLIGIALSSVATGIVALFLSPVYFQIAIFILMSIFFLWMSYGISLRRGAEADRSLELQSVLAKDVTVHYWDGRKTKVQLNGKVWPAEFAEYPDAPLKPGRYKVWKILNDKLILIDIEGN